MVALLKMPRSADAARRSDAHADPLKLHERRVFPRKEIHARVEGRRLDPALPGWTAPPRALEKWYMTDLLHALVHSRIPLQGVPISGRWVEIDSVGDLALAEELATERGGSLKIRG